MARVHFTANLKRHVDAPLVEASGTCVREVLDRVFALHPRLRGYVVDEHGSLRRHMAIFVDGNQVFDRTGLGDPVREASEIHVFQALSGGASPAPR